MDEPLAGLDQQSRTKIIKLIMTECNNRTLIVITHDKEILPYMNKKINLQSLKND
jgi:ABC-type lipoprotein export system ATPase subunit